MSVIVRESSKVIKFSELGKGDAGAWIEFRSNQISDPPLDVAGRLERILRNGGVELSHFRATLAGRPSAAEYDPANKVNVNADPLTLVNIRACIYVPEIRKLLDNMNMHCNVELTNGRTVSLFAYQRNENGDDEGYDLSGDRKTLAGFKLGLEETGRTVSAFFLGFRTTNEEQMQKLLNMLVAAADAGAKASEIQDQVISSAKEMGIEVWDSKTKKTL